MNEPIVRTGMPKLRWRLMGETEEQADDRVNSPGYQEYSRRITEQHEADMREQYGPKWIPCAERMPEVDVDVLVFTGGPTMLLNSDRVAIGCWAGSDWETSLGVYTPPIISHWMPLPGGPEVKG